MVGTLYTYPNNFRAYKIQIASKYAEKNIKVVQDAPDFVLGTTDKTDNFLKKFPLGKVPAFEDEDIKLNETNAIAYYVGNDQTRGRESEPLVLQWIGFADNEILPLVCTWVYPTMGMMQYNKQATEKSKTGMKEILNVLNTHLATRTWFVGERVTQADISIACTLLMAYQNVLDSDFRKDYKNLNRWFVTAVNQPEFKAVIGEIKLCEKMAQFDAKLYNEIQGKSEKKKAVTPKKKTETKKAGGDNKAKESKKPEVQLAKVEEKKDPWIHLPATTFDMDAFKRCYCNNDADHSEKYFWDHFDKEKYSLWSMNYKYNEELSVTFMATNLVNGMYQRLDKLRKHAFANCLVLKKGSELKISGLWFWRGLDLPFTLSPDWQTDYIHYNWVKLDPDSPETKELVKKYWSWEGDFDGFTCEDGSTYK